VASIWHTREVRRERGKEGERKEGGEGTYIKKGKAHISRRGRHIYQEKCSTRRSLSRVCLTPPHTPSHVSHSLRLPLSPSLRL
jgi:hypothetical protein